MGAHDQTDRELSSAAASARDRPARHDQAYRERRPAAALQRYLSCMWVQEVAPGAAPYAHRTVPNGGVELSCRVGVLPRIDGPQTGPAEEVLDPGAIVVGVRFRPGAAPSVLGVPASELVDQSIGADELWGAWATELGERVAAAGSPHEALGVLERAVASRLAARSSGEPDQIAAEAVRRLLPWRDQDVGSLPGALYISERQLRRRFQTAIGVAPKVLQRMLRFQGFLALAQTTYAPDDLARLAADAGYADQSHLTRESVRLAGRSPRELLRDSERNCRTAHDHAPSYDPLLRARGLHAA